MRYNVLEYRVQRNGINRARNGTLTRKQRAAATLAALWPTNYAVLRALITAFVCVLNYYLLCFVARIVRTRLVRSFSSSVLLSARCLNDQPADSIVVPDRFERLSRTFFGSSRTVAVFPVTFGRSVSCTVFLACAFVRSFARSLAFSAAWRWRSCARGRSPATCAHPVIIGRN